MALRRLAMIARRGSSTLPLLCACLGMMTFCMMDAIMKGLSIAIGAYNAIFWRVLVGVFFGAIVFFSTRSRWPTRAAMRLHLLRGIVATVFTLAWFWGIARVPLAEGTAITFIAPLIALYLAALLLKENVKSSAVLASLLGFCGVMVIIAGRLGITHGEDALHGIAAILFSALLYAWNLILQRQQALLATPIEIAFFQNIVVLLLLAIPAPFAAEIPSVHLVPGIIASAALTFISLLLLSWAYARAEAQVLLTVEYTAFIWAAILGWFMFDEYLTVRALIGTTLIVISCIIAARLQTLARAPIRPTAS
jgi:S-adenosylmethionine uptake transporter